MGAAVQPREAAVADHRVADDRQRAQRRRRHRKRAAVKRPEVVVGGVGVLPVSTTRSVTMAIVSLEKNKTGNGYWLLVFHFRQVNRNGRRADVVVSQVARYIYDKFSGSKRQSSRSRGHVQDVPEKKTTGSGRSMTF